MGEIKTIGSPGLTLLARLLQGNAYIGTVIPLTQSLPGVYLGDIPLGTPAGDYTVIVTSGAAVYAMGDLAWDGIQEVNPATEAQRLRDIHQIHGLEIGQPLMVTTATRKAGTMVQTIAGGPTNTTVTRTV